MGETPGGEKPVPPAPSAPERGEHRTAIRVAVLSSVIAGVAAIVAAAVPGVFTLLSSSDGASTSEANTPSPPGGVPTTPGAGTFSESPTPSAPGGTASLSADKVRWAKPLRLTYVNLDSVPAQVLSSNSGASAWVNYGTSRNVLYGLNGGVFTTKPSIAAWEGAPHPTRQQCADLISTQGTEKIPIADDSRFCVKTAADRVAYLVIKRFDSASGTYLADVTVWETPQE
jgi:hypothetical protein